MAETSVVKELKLKVNKIKLLLLDVDGVLTDGKIIYDSAGRDTKNFSVTDGLGITLLKKAGIPTVLISAKGSGAIKPRARDMGVEDIFENASPKTAVLERILKKYRVSAEEVCFAGDDLVDVCLMKKIGFPVAVFNAAAEVKQAASYITLKEGGRGAVREIAELILKFQDKWQQVLKSYDIG
ncbi:MAG: HAD hydrolase family protein [Candidatus Omnitrophica bacterium]|nr:HAD hydrolase family protein [Candidatus Omnitrophota bacterium]